MCYGRREDIIVTKRDSVSQNIFQNIVSFFEFKFSFRKIGELQASKPVISFDTTCSVILFSKDGYSSFCGKY
jgi:hypothetical protein